MKLKTYMILETNRDMNAARQPIIVANPFKIKIRKGFLTEDIKDSLDVKEDWTPGQAERPYFFPGCTVPRFKVRETFNITIKPEYATAAFISPETLEGSVDGFDAMTRMYPYKFTDIFRWIKTTYGDNHPFTIKIQSLGLNAESTILMHNDCVEKIRFVAVKITSNPNYGILTDPERRLSFYVGNVYTERTSLYIPKPESIIDRLTCEIYDQRCMLRLINKDCIILDQKRYEELCVMASAADKDNLSTVMELIANCDFDKSCVYLLCLLQKYGTEMAPMKGASHVNFKSLLHYFQLDVKVINDLKLDKLISILESLGKLTQNNFLKVSALFPIKTEGELKVTHKYVIPGYTLKEEYLSQLDDENIIEDTDDIDIPEGDVAFINQ